MLEVNLGEVMIEVEVDCVDERIEGYDVEDEEEDEWLVIVGQEERGLLRWLKVVHNGINERE